MPEELKNTNVFCGEDIYDGVTQISEIIIVEKNTTDAEIWEEICLPNDIKKIAFISNK